MNSTQVLARRERARLRVRGGGADEGVEDAPRRRGLLRRDEQVEGREPRAVRRARRVAVGLEEQAELLGRVLQAVLAVQSKQFPPPKTIGRTKERLAKLAEA